MRDQQVATWSWGYYKFSVPRGNGFVVEMNGTTPDSTSDCDIYVKYNGLPMHTRYDWRDISLGTNARHEFSQPQAGDWYIGVFGFTSCRFQLKATLLGSCPAGCSGHGDCISGTCFCNVGWTGDACQNALTSLTVNGPETVGTVAARGWSFFNVRLLQPAPLLRVRVTEQSSDRMHDVDVYVRYDKVPSMFEWDYANATLADATLVSITDARAGYWYIGVYGFQCPTGTVCRFSVQVSTPSAANTCPNQCSNHGTCNPVTSLCQCAQGYSGEYCGTRNDPLLPGGCACDGLRRQRGLELL